MSERLQPAFWGGLLIGVLSALPVVNIGNCCCCLWVLVGGGLAAYLRQQNTPYQIQAAEGAIVGMIAGAIGGVIQSVLSIPLEMMAGPLQQQIMDRVLSNPEVDPQFREMMENLATHSGGLRIVGMLVTVVIYTVFGLFGGLLGAAIFKKNLPPPPPPGPIDMPPPSAPIDLPPPPPPPPSV